MRNENTMEMVHFIPSSQRRLALLAAQADSTPVLIRGASGTGKGAIAQWIHSNGPRAARVFRYATRNQGLADQIFDAHRGTLVILDVGEWNFSEQKVLLTYLKTKTVLNQDEDFLDKRPSLAIESSLQKTTEKVFKKTKKLPRIVDTRIVCTTRQALEDRAQGGLFNVDLLKKLTAFEIQMPALNQRLDEFDDIVTGISGEIIRELHKEYIRQISPQAWMKLRAYDWPGNLRELRNVLRLAILSAKTNQLEVSDLPDFGYNRIDFQATREEFEKNYLVGVLEASHWKIEEACHIAHLDRAELLKKVKHYQIVLQSSE